MRKTIFLYSLILAGLVFLLKYFEYHYLVRDLSLEFYIGLVAVLFTVIGVWAGLKLTARRSATTDPFVQYDENILKGLSISKREYEVLDLMAKGLTNQEIADKLFVSLNTVKTHTSNLFVKLDVKRRTQAIQKARDLKLIP